MESSARITSTYRIQFSPLFKFSDASRLVPYLKEMGISHVYSSPIMEALPGSVHGYDVADFSRIREELGGEKHFEELNSSLRNAGIGWIQDFVPNHMAMDTRNPYIRDVLEKGMSSEFSALFDIYWDHPAFEDGKLCLPILDRPYYTELEDGNFSFHIAKGIVLRYKGTDIPLNPMTYGKLLGREVPPRALIYLSVYGGAMGGKNAPTGRADEVSGLHDLLEKLESAGKNMSLTDKVISMQNYSLRERLSTAFEINYRRFFAVNGLICLREEDAEVFWKVHEKLLSLLESGKIDGIRIDHADGLLDPGKYLRMLREATGNAYIVVEKILGRDEQLDNGWPVQGTTGYDFLGKVTSLMCSGPDLPGLHDAYTEFTGEEYEKNKTLHSLKLETVDSLFPAVLDIIAHAFWKALRRNPHGRGLTLHGTREAIREILAHTGIYRTYLSGSEHSERDRGELRAIIQKSSECRRDLSAYFDALEMAIDHFEETPEFGTAIQILQQYMPAMYAKPVEDRLFYIYNRLVSLNEVGANPFDWPVSVSDFHEFNRERRANFPLSMNALSTHDTKVSEDVRARICVLSEIPGEWMDAVQRWHRINSGLSASYKGSICPSANEEYYIYQLLLGSYPDSLEELGKYRERLLAHLVKSIREAGVHTGWDSPNPEYERLYTGFFTSILDSSRGREFLDGFRKMQNLVSYHGFLNSLSQKILQLTAPGIPDTYQGTEIWNFNLVDPDNRREVDFMRIEEIHRQVTGEFRHGPGVVGSYLRNYSDGRIKLLVSAVLLNLRKEMPEVFLEGNYVPVHVSGPHEGNVVAFLRKAGGKTLLVLVPRLTVSLGRMRIPAGKSVWAGDSISVPESADCDFEDVFTGRIRSLSSGSSVPVGDLMEDTPFCVMVSR